MSIPSETPPPLPKSSAPLPKIVRPHGPHGPAGLAHLRLHTAMKGICVGIGVVALAVVVVHGRSISVGLLLDDFNHRAELRDGDFSFRSLVEASHLGNPRRRVQMWWQEEADLTFFRPFSFFLMRVGYVSGGWRPSVMHGLSLLWTVAVAAVVMHLAADIGLGRGWAFLAGLLFALHPANTLTTWWIACQNEQMVTFFVLIALACYARWSGWRWRVDGEPPPRAGAGYLVAAIAAWIAALGCRENAVMWLPLVVLGDWILRPERTRGRRRIYVLLGAMLASYLAVRHATLGPLEMPGRPYALPPEDPDFLRFVIDKFVYCILGLAAFVPIIGFGGMQYLQENPALFYGSFAAVAGVWTAAILWLRPGRVVALWLLVATVPLLPVLPVFASAHHLYLASAGIVLAAVTLLRALWKRLATPHTRCGRRWRAVLTVAIIVNLAGFAGIAILTGIGLAGFHAGSQLPAEEVDHLAGPLRPGDRLFFINLPPIGFNCMPAIEEKRQVAPLTGYVLTFGSSLLRMNEEAYLERTGPRSLRVWQEGEGYFSGLIGHAMMQAVGRERPFPVGTRFANEDFEVEVVRADTRGVQELLFTFRRPLDDPGYHFFFSSPVFSAYPLRFGPWRDALAG